MKSKTKEDLFMNDQLILKHFGKFIIAFGLCFLFFDLIVKMPGLLSFIFSGLISYLIIKYLVNKK